MVLQGFKRRSRARLAPRSAVKELHTKVQENAILNLAAHSIQIGNFA
jgi:hypothetical protein